VGIRRHEMITSPAQTEVQAMRSWRMSERKNSGVEGPRKFSIVVGQRSTTPTATKGMKCWLEPQDPCFWRIVGVPVSLIADYPLGYICIERIGP
jgi:hypothetical protein